MYQSKSFFILKPRGRFFFSLPLCIRQNYAILYETDKPARLGQTELRRAMERFVGGVKNAKGEEHCCEGLENCSSVGKSPTCSSQIFTSISLRLELNLEWYSDRSLYPSVSTTSPCRMWSVERISTARNKLHSAASFFEFLSTVAVRIHRIRIYDRNTEQILHKN